MYHRFCDRLYSSNRLCLLVDRAGQELGGKIDFLGMCQLTEMEKCHENTSVLQNLGFLALHPDELRARELPAHWVCIARGTLGGGGGGVTAHTGTAEKGNSIPSTSRAVLHGY